MDPSQQQIYMSGDGARQDEEGAYPSEASVSDSTGSQQSLPFLYQMDVNDVPYYNIGPGDWTPIDLTYPPGWVPPFALCSSSSIFAQPDQSSTMVIIEPQTPVLCDCDCGGGPRVPHRPYVPPQAPEDSIIMECIYFSVTGAGCGIHIIDVLRRKFGSLKGRDDPMLSDSGTSISLRFEWPGCPPWSRQIKTQDWRRNPSPIKRSKLATEIAKSLERFIQEMQRAPQADSRWRVGPGFIEARDLVLISLKHVSRGSWQPHFRLR